MDRTIRRVRSRGSFISIAQTGCTMADIRTQKVDMILVYGATDCNGRAAPEVVRRKAYCQAAPAHTHVCSPTPAIMSIRWLEKVKVLGSSAMKSPEFSQTPLVRSQESSPLGWFCNDSG
ncbi:hypothetical protein TNCV_3247351 [Trichonephila clavipes]|nr:hypothetical protein TNCV_3247351 [Trichonephila clavipes]